jgi:DNA-binding HxlR family transcriptional regulator
MESRGNEAMVKSSEEMMVDPDGAAFSEGSPARCQLGRIADKWAVLIMGILLRKPFHFLELHREVGGVSRKVLTNQLRKLERDGLVQRCPDENSSGVRYSLTSLGQSLCGPLNGLRRWAEAHADDITAAQEKIDKALEAKESHTVGSQSRHVVTDR